MFRKAIKPVKEQRKKEDAVNYKQLVALGAVGAVAVSTGSVTNVFAEEVEISEVEQVQELTKPIVELAPDNNLQTEQKEQAEQLDEKLSEDSKEVTVNNTNEQPEVTDTVVDLDENTENQNEESINVEEQKDTENKEVIVEANENTSGEDKEVTNLDEINKESDGNNNEVVVKEDTENSGNLVEVEVEVTAQEKDNNTVVETAPETTEKPEEIKQVDTQPEELTVQQEQELTFEDLFTTPDSLTGNANLDKKVGNIVKWSDWVKTNSGLVSSNSENVEHTIDSTKEDTVLTDEEYARLQKVNKNTGKNSTWRDSKGNAYYGAELVSYGLQTKLGDVITWTGFTGINEYYLGVDSDSISTQNTVTVELPVDTDFNYAFVLEMKDGTKVLLDHKVDNRDVALIDVSISGKLHIISDAPPVSNEVLNAGV